MKKTVTLLIACILFSTQMNYARLNESDLHLKENSLLKIAMLQMPSIADQEWNKKKGEKYCREAKKMGADIALFPEMINIGYNSVDFDKPAAMEEWMSMAVSRNGEFVCHSCVFSADGSEVFVADEKSGVKMTTINLEDVREYRSWTYWGNSYRRPHKYRELISPDVRDPFHRKDGVRQGIQKT